MTPRRVLDGPCRGYPDCPCDCLSHCPTTPAGKAARDPADRIRPEVFRARLAELLVELLAPSDVERVVGGVRAWWARART
jgi:hypothetical protein